MKISTFIPALLAAMSIAGAAHAGQTVAQTTVIIDTPHCYSNLSPYVCSVAEMELAQLAAHYAQHEGNSDEQILPAQAKSGAQNDAAAAPIPEPQMAAMMVIGLVLLGFASTRREVYEKFSA